MRDIWTAFVPPVAVIVGHSALAAAVGHRPELDPLFHFLGGAAGAYCLLRVLRTFRVDLCLNSIGVVLITMFAIVAAWEVVEFGSDRLLGTHVQLGSDDTAMDMIVGMAGAVCVTLASALIDAKGRTRPGASD